MADARFSRLAPAVVASLILAAASTAGDWIWKRWIPDGAVVPGIVHGVLIFLIVAAVLARATGTRLAARRLVPSLPIVGLVLAAAFYPIAWLTGYVAALLITWTAMWLSFALLQRWAESMASPLGEAALRGALAALTSGLAFWAISGIWTGDPEVGYGLRFLYWTFAFLPGFLALLLETRARRGAEREAP